MRRYASLVGQPLSENATWLVPPAAPPRATLDSPAIDVMTDLSVVSAVSIGPEGPLDAANEYMRSRGVRSLFVVAADARVLGLLTATDLLGERPLRVARSRGVRRDELAVADVMTPVGSLVAFRLRDVLAAKVGHIVASLKETGRHHALVAEAADGGAMSIRGIFSVSEIARRLGEPLSIPEVATTFAEVEQALV